MWKRHAGRLRALWLAACLASVATAPLGASILFGEDGTKAAASFEELSAKASLFRESGNASGAIPFYQSALELRPDWAEGWWYLGTTFYDANRYQEASFAFGKLVELSPDFGPALAFLGLSEFEMKSYERSFSHLQQADASGYEDEPELAKVAKYHLAILLNSRGKFEKALEALTAFDVRRAPDQARTAIGMAVLRIPLLPDDVDPRHDALIHAAGDAAGLMMDGKPAQAADAFQHLVAEYPKTPYLHYAYAVALARANKKEDALKQLAEEIKVHDSALPYIRMATLELELHDTTKAETAARRAVKLDAKSCEAHNALAQALRQLGRKQQAAEEFAVSKELERSPPEPDLLQQKLYSRKSAAGEESSATAAIENHEATIGDKQTQFEEIARRAEATREAGQVEEAVADFQKALDLRRDWPEGWQTLGTLYYGAGEYAEASKALENAVVLDPRNGTAWALLGLAEFETKDYKNALIHLQRGRDLGLSGNATAVQVATYHLALLLNRSGDFDRATTLLTPGVGAGPVSDDTKIALGIALLRMPVFPGEVSVSTIPLVRQTGEAAAFLVESKYDQAFALLTELIGKYPDAPFLHYAYGCALLSASHFDEAERELAAESNLNPASALPYRRRAALALQSHRQESALQFAQRAVQLDSESAEGHYLLGRSMLELGKAQASVKELERARELAPNSPEVHFNLARAYAKAGQREAAAAERITFEQLNEAVQRQRSQMGSQAYGAHQNDSGLHAAQGNASNKATVQSQ